MMTFGFIGALRRRPNDRQDISGRSAIGSENERRLAAVGYGLASFPRADLSASHDRIVFVAARFIVALGGDFAAPSARWCSRADLHRPLFARKLRAASSPRYVGRSSVRLRHRPDGAHRIGTMVILGCRSFPHSVVCSDVFGVDEPGQKQAEATTSLSSRHANVSRAHSGRRSVRRRVDLAPSVMRSGAAAQNVGLSYVSRTHGLWF